MFKKNDRVKVWTWLIAGNNIYIGRFGTVTDDPIVYVRVLLDGDAYSTPFLPGELELDIKFKAGDRVKVIDYLVRDLDPNFVGSVGTVAEIDKYIYVTLDKHNECERWLFEPYELEHYNATTV